MRNSTKSLTALALVLLLVALSDALAQRRRGLVDVSPSSERHGFWLNAGLAAGGENYRFDAPGTWQPKDQVEPAFWLALGGTVSPNLRLGGEVNAWVYEHPDPDNPTSQYRITDYLTGALLVGQVYPARHLGLYLKGGLGISRSGESVSGGGYGVGETGFAYLAGLGYEVRLGRNIFLTPAANVMFHRSGGDRTDPNGALHERVWTVGVGLTFQPGR
jgi:hypothetical protein